MKTMTAAGDVRGFTLLELLVVVALISIVAGMAVPAITSTSAQMRLANAARQVERELQTARMKAVRADRVMRVRFNCPATGEYRMVELLGTVRTPATDDADSRAAVRCGNGSYPYPDTDPEFFAAPNNDGPVQTLLRDVAFSTVQTIDFWPDGTAHTMGATTPISGTGVTLQVYDVTRGTSVNKSITVNGLGKVTLQ
ncbi:MAG: prepilin-type N-terminal cleavage/methylation domain-containing protein [Vicinamibacteria bacterium]|nr:prepilin-type N-terminal cleavage/methylation domain-containing protein [Vicinamibacteria bacterium]